MTHLGNIVARNSKTRAFRHAILATVGTAPLWLAGAAAAQSADAQNTEPPSAQQVLPQGGPIRSSNTDTQTVNEAGGRPVDAETGESLSDGSQPSAGVGEIVVTGSRIVRDGYSAPTPVSVIGTADIQANAPANLADFVNTLPAIAGSSTPANSSGSLSNGNAGINALNLRSLGTNRTLVLLDGQRSVASSVNGTVDINTFPQELVERVEVVTGGASSAYGSDAVGGVVNFILNKNYQGFKASAESGITTYGDTPTYKLTMTAGKRFLDDRLRVIVSGEYFKQDGRHTIDRDWNKSRTFLITNPDYTATNGLPQYIVASNVGLNQMTPGGLIRQIGATAGAYAGPLEGTYFGLIDPATGVATTGILNFGAQSAPYMVGGDAAYTLSSHLGTNTLSPDEERITGFGRVSFDVTDSFQIFGQVSYNRYEGLSYYQASRTPSVTIAADNAYLPASVRTALAAGGYGSLIMGTTNAGIPAAGSHNTREVFRYVAGANGSFGIGGGQWKWDAYYQKGVMKAHELLVNTWNTARLALATDAVFAPAGNAAGLAAGTIVCRSTLTDPANGCVPINRIGVGGITQEALDYIFGPGQPERFQTIKQDVAAVSVNGTLFRLPAGPVAVAFGGEWRREQVDGTVDPLYQSGWQYGNYQVNRGSYDVTEGFVELAVPVFTGFDVNAAGRFTHYSTSGDVQTWKVGATWQPIKDIRLRGTISRDIRAPNLNELFASGTRRTNTVQIPLANGTFRPDTFLENTTGNLDLQPEKADSWSVGAVLTPTFLPGFALSADYFDISIKDAIGVISADNTAILCYVQNVQSFCDNIIVDPATGLTQQINLKPINFSSQKARGLDIETSYRVRLDEIASGLPGDLTLRGLVTYNIENTTDNGINLPVDGAGSNTGNGPPSWVYNVSATYSVADLTFNLTGRGISDGVYNNNYVECTSGCPASTADNRTINDNHIDGALFVDTSITVKFPAWAGQGSLQLAIRNLFDKDPVIIGNGPSQDNTTAYPQTNRNFYDTLGRTFRVVARIAL
ncbi:TonB-dependent receptor [Sphingomonas cannabina]|uniref:TonB-dependent receptor plug domain-containing protein n=1 Tax=Sphingomonas cannabina TaxID=2899123 RepID=UPI001F22FE67|nr:TonB-dependent receptor [Sphingomonas cannabina]UIJ46353.1 TonB-dependent receptor [Sphingomonas cannabina]